MYLNFNWRFYQFEHRDQIGETAVEDIISHWLNQSNADSKYLYDKNTEYKGEYCPAVPNNRDYLNKYINITNKDLLKGFKELNLIPAPEINKIQYYANKIEPADFNIGYYLVMNPDISINKPSDAYQHYNLFGYDEQRKASKKPETEPYWLDNVGKNSWQYYIDNDLPFPRIKDNIAYKKKFSLRLPSNITTNELETILKWITNFNYKIKRYHLESTDDLMIMLDFNQIGGTYFYSTCLWSYFIDQPILRIVSFWSKYYLIILRGVVEPIIHDNATLLCLLQKFKISKCFTNHTLDWDINIIDRILNLAATKITVFHDYEWLKYPNLLLKHDYIISQSKSIGEVYLGKISNLRKKLVFISHPDYVEINGSFTYNKVENGKKRIAMIGAISPKKGAFQLQELLPLCKDRNIQIYILGILNKKEFNYEPYILDGTLTIEGYNSIDEFNNLLRKFQPHAFWFHNNINYTMETWLYTLTLALLSGLPILANDVPIIKERAPNALFYTDIRDIFTLDFPLSNKVNLIKNLIKYPFWYYKFFNYDSDLYLLKNLNTINVNTQIITMFRNYLDSQTYIPDILEFEPLPYKNNYHDLKDLTDVQLYNHWLLNGNKEGRFPNSYKGLFKDPTAPSYIINIYKDIYNTNSKFNPSLKYDSSRKYALVFFETRKTELFEPITKLMLKRAKNKANLYIFCNKFNYEYFKSKIPDVEAKYIIYDELAETINMDTYSHLLKSANFWNHINEEYIISYQTDSFPLKEIPFEILSRTSFGLAGAWHYKSTFGYFNINTPKGVGVNGGFAYRRKSLLLKCIENITDKQIDDYRVAKGFHPYRSEIPEDCYYYHAMEILGLPLPDNNFCDTYFAQDKDLTSLGRTIFGYHGILYGNMKMDNFYKLLMTAKAFYV